MPGALAEEVAEVLLAYGAQSAAVEEFRAAGATEQVGGGCGGRGGHRRRRGRAVVNRPLLHGAPA